MRTTRQGRWAAVVVLGAALAQSALAAGAAEGDAAATEARNARAPQPSKPGEGDQPPKPAKPADAVQPPKPAEPTTPVPQGARNAVGEFQPVLHAQGANISTCMDTIVAESANVIDSAHTAISSWNTAAPDENPFVSIVGLSYANKAAPNAAAIIVAAPTGPNTCKGETVQVYPVAQSCSAIQASLIKDGHTIATLRALPIVEAKSGVRNVLIPSVGGGCVVVAVTLR